MTPLKPSSSRRIRWTIFGDSVAGRSSSIEVTSTCAVMINATPASMAALNGANSMARSRSGACSTIGSSRCESAAVSPCPGKCLPQAATPLTLQLVDDDAAQLRHDVRLLAQRPIADDRIFRVGVDVEDGRVVERDADGGQFRRQCAGKLPRKCRVFTSTQHRHRRPLRKRRSQARDAPAFLVDAYPGRHFAAEGAHVERETRHLLRRFDISEPPEERHAA